MLIPQELLLKPLAKITNGDQQPETFAQMKQKITELACRNEAKVNDPTLTAVDKARLNAVAPITQMLGMVMPTSEKLCMGHCSNLGKKQWCWQVDTHNAWAATLHAHETNHEVGVEFYNQFSIIARN